jgi:hypothetical protein
MAREPEAWGGEVRLPRWLQRVMGREAQGDTPEAAHESRRSDVTDYQKLDHMRAAGTVAPHHSELPRSGAKRRR